MSKERIFELIRKEELILFSGAGMSLYAGYPSGVTLAKVLYENLTNDLKDKIDFTYDLPKLAEEIYNLKGGNKNYIIETLKNEILKEPTKTETHELLAKIPQIKTIITTNYDTLFESTNKNLEIIRKSADYSIANPKKQWLFKIHGDLSDTTNIILTSSDYNNYFVTNSEQNIFWNAVKDKLASNHILFVGYSLEDSNIITIITKIIKELGDNRKEIFFVAPSIKESKLSFFQMKGIKFIKSTGEELFKELTEDLKLNYLPGLSKGNGNADTALNFANSNLINIELGKNKDSIIINNVNSINRDNKSEVKFKIEGNDEKTKKIIDSLRGKDFEDIILDKNIIKEYSYFLNGIRIKNEDDIKNILVKKIPPIDGNFDIRFDDDFEIDNYNIQIFVAKPNEKESHLKILLNDFTIILKIELNEKLTNNKFKIEIIPSNSISSVNNGLKFYNLLARITNNQKFELFKENELFYTYDNKINFIPDALDAKFLLNYFQQLKKIEKYFKIRFTNINLEYSDQELIYYILSYINKSELKMNLKSYTFKKNNKEELDFIIKNGEQETIFIITTKNIIIKLHDLEFKINYLHKHIKDAYVANIEDLKNNKTDEIEIKSKSNTIYYQFSDNLN